MPRINRVIGFLTVSFILLFVAKINKMGLFSVYVKTIADVEVRNSQSISVDQPQAYHVAETVEAKVITSGSAALFVALLSLDERAVESAESPPNEVARVIPVQRIPQLMPRAPALAA